MNTKAVRLYGAGDLRLEEFALPKIREDEILAQIVSDSICMSSYKAALQGKKHKRVPDDIENNPTIIGHEFCGRILEVGSKWKGQFKAGDKYSIQPALYRKEDPYSAIGYSFRYIGGSATHVIIPNIVMELGCLLPYDDEAFYFGSVAEPLSCIIGAFHASYHTKPASYVYKMGTVKGGNLAILGGVGPMGLGAIDYAIHNERKPKLLLVTDIDSERLRRAERIYTPQDAAKLGVKLIYMNTAKMSSDEIVRKAYEMSGGQGFDDVFVFTPTKEVVRTGDEILGHDGCLNFFAGPTVNDFTAEINFYNVHYKSTHILGTSGGNTDDLKEALQLMSAGRLNPSSMITHVGGLNCVVDTTLNLPEIGGGKKLIYTNISMELTKLEDFAEKGKTDPVYKRLAEIISEHNGLWNAKAESYLLENSEKI